MKTFLFFLFLSTHVIAASCPRAVAIIGDFPMICTDKANFAKGAKSSGFIYLKSVKYKQIFKANKQYSLPAKLINVYNDDDDLVMSQFLFPANDSKNSYKSIRVSLEEKYGLGKRIVGYERSPQFEYKWRLKDGVVISFKKRKGNSKARLTYAINHKARAFLTKVGLMPKY